MYNSNPEKMNAHLDRIADRVQEGEDNWVLSTLMQLFIQISLHHPEVCNLENYTIFKDQKK